MISRAARVPRICLACRFGLTQRSAVLGFRAAPITHSLGQRRRYTSDIGKTGDGKIESFITGANIPAEAKPKEEESSERTETATKPEDMTSDIKSSPEAETTEEVVSKLKSDQDAKPTSDTQSEPPSTESSLEKPIDPLQATRDETTTQASAPASSEQPLHSSEKNSDSSAEQPADSSEDSMFELPIIPELESELEPTVLPTKRFRHELVHDESLGVSALGVPADAIIINNPNQIRRSKKVPIVVESQPVQPPSEFDWNRLAPGENEDESSSEDIFRNIEELCPDNRFLRDSEIETLTGVLWNGFTTDQLKEYTRLRKAEVVTEDAINYSWIVEHIPWTPPTKTEIRGHDKLAYVQRIIYDLWKIESQKSADEIGRTIVQIEPDFFVFLTFESDRMVRELREDFLVGEEEKITLDRNQGHLNIVAKKATAYGILAHLDHILQRRKIRDIPIRQHVALIPSVAELEVLSQITKTSLKILENQELRVSWLPGSQEKDAESKTEDLADVVFRLLLGHPNPGTTVHMECLPRPQTRRIPGDHFFDIRRQLKALSWREKLQGWQRVVIPINNKPDEGSSEPLDLVGSVSLPEYQPDKHGYRNVTTATFGHVLHNKSQVGKLKGAKTRKKGAKAPDIDPTTGDMSTPWVYGGLVHPKNPVAVAVLSEKRRSFSPLIPHPASFSALKPEGSDPLTQSTTIILNLAVHGDRSAAKTWGPAIQVHLPVDAEADLANFSIPKDATAYCAIPWYRNDLLLPGESVDVRIQHERLLPLDLDASGLRSFLETSEFNLLQGHLRTPSQATLLIPSAHLVPVGQPSSSRSKQRIYTFRGLEIHQTIEMPWRDHTLRYSSIEAGQHGGQRQELTLQAGKPDDSGTSFEDEKRKSFLQLVEDMATGQCFSWTEGYEFIKSRQLEDHSYDLPEEELTEDIIVDDGTFDTHDRSNFRRYEEPVQPKRKYMPRRETMDTPRRPRRFDVLEDTEQFRETDESDITVPKFKGAEPEGPGVKWPDVKEPEAKEPEVDQASARKPDSTVPEANELKAKEQKLDQASVKTDAAPEEIKEPEAKEPEADQTSAKKPQQGRRAAKSQSTTDLLHSFLDQFADPISLKTPTGQRGGDRNAEADALTNNTLIQEVVTRFNARQAEENLRARQTTSEDAFSAKFSARATDKPPIPPKPTHRAKRKGSTKHTTNKHNKQQATPHSSQFKDPFAAAFANRLSTTPQRTSSGGDGFFDDIPKPHVAKKKGAARGKRKRR